MEMLLTKVLTDGFLVIVTYYLGMVMWSAFIYLYRNTFSIITKMNLEYEYDTGELNYLTDDVKKMMVQVAINMSVMIIVNIVASLFCIIYMVLLGLPMFILISIPLVFLIGCLFLLMGVFNNRLNKDVHKVQTMLG